MKETCPADISESGSRGTGRRSGRKATHGGKTGFDLKFFYLLPNSAEENLLVSLATKLLTFIAV